MAVRRMSSQVASAREITLRDLPAVEELPELPERLARIAPEEAAGYDAEMRDWFRKLLDALQRLMEEDRSESEAIKAEAGATADQTASEIEAGYNAQVPVASQAEAEAGTSTDIRRWSPLRVAQAIAALGGGGGGGGTYEEFTICVDGAPETRWWPTWESDPS